MAQRASIVGLDGMEISPEDLSTRIQEVFSRFDKDGGGSLDRQELHLVFKVLGPKLTSKQINSYCKQLDRGGDGDVTPQEFMTWMLAGSSDAKDVLALVIKETGDAMAQSVREVFNRFDSDGGGQLDMNELARVFRTLDSNLSMKDLEALCKELDRGGDGSVSVKEFLAWLKKGGDWARSISRAIMKNTGNAREERIKKAFAKYDSGGDGSINIEELRQALRVLGSFSNDEVKNICADLDRSGDGEIDFPEFAAWIKSGKGAKEVLKAKAILAPSDSDGLEGVFYNFCGPGKADLDGKAFKKVFQDSELMDKKLDGPTIDLIFSDKRVKDKTQRQIDFFQFENALELVSEKKGMPKADIRAAILLQGGPKYDGTSTGKGATEYRRSTTGLPLSVIAALEDGQGKKRTTSQRRIAEIMRMPENDIPGRELWRKDTDNSKLWKVFGLDTSAGRTLKRIYNPPNMSPTLLPSRSRSKQEGHWQSPFLTLSHGTLSHSFSAPTLATAPGPPKAAW